MEKLDNILAKVDTLSRRVGPINRLVEAVVERIAPKSTAMGAYLCRTQCFGFDYGCYYGGSGFYEKYGAYYTGTSYECFYGGSGWWEYLCVSSC
jgi:hypothetical protein